MTTRYRYMQLSGWGVSGGEWVEFTDESLAEKMGGRAAGTFEAWTNDPQLYVEVFRNGNWRPASIRALPLWEHASRLEIRRIGEEAARVVVNAERAYREQGAIVEAALEAAKRAEDVLREQRARLTSVEDRLKADQAKAKKLNAEAASLNKSLDRRLAAFDAASTPEPVTA